MCTTNVYTYVYPDGRQKTLHEPSLCTFSRRGHVCANNTIFQHPPQYVGATSVPMQMPPTPTYTPRTATPVYRSGDESDRSLHSGGSGSSRSKKRSSAVYINGQKVYLDDGHRMGSPSRHERIVLVDGPPTQRTPPQTFPAASRSAPSSPSTPYVVSSGPRDAPSSRRPIIVDERLGDYSNGLHIDNTFGHRRQSSRESKHSHSASDEDKAARRQRKREAAEALAREEKTRERIAKANARIANRPAVPVAPSPPTVRRSSTSTTAATRGGSPPASSKGYVRPHVEVHSDREAELADAVRRLSFEEEMREEKARKLARREREGRTKAREEVGNDEEEAQRQRLRERIMPKRRSTVGPGSRRSRVLYDEGLYRWE